jgi:hypothetical protein
MVIVRSVGAVVAAEPSPLPHATARAASRRPDAASGRRDARIDTFVVALTCEVSEC